MTLGVVVPTPTGIVLASDSLGYQTDDRYFANARKIVEVGRTVFTFSGAVLFRDRLIDSHLDGLSQGIDGALSIEETLREAVEHLLPLHGEQMERSGADLRTTLVAAGFDTDGVGRVYLARLPDGDIQIKADTDGQRHPFWIGDAGFLTNLGTNFIMRLPNKTMDEAADLAARLVCHNEGMQRLVSSWIDGAPFQQSIRGPATIARITVSGVSFETWECGPRRIVRDPSPGPSD